MLRLPDALSAAALVYLAAPAFVFLLGWLEMPMGIAIIGLLSVALFQLIKQLPKRTLPQSAFGMAWIAAIALIWSALGGAGHLVYANVDWATRDAVYADLILSSWPPSYGQHLGAPLVLRTAMGFFLPPAAFAKIVGLDWASMILMTWTALGVALFLALIPFPRRSFWCLALTILVVIFFSGMDYLGILLVHGHLPIFPLPLEWWRQWTFSSLTAQLFWAPNHALALWLGTALFFRHRFDAALAPLAVVMLPLLLLWTPFAVIGLIPWFAWAASQSSQPWISVLRLPGAAQWFGGTMFAAIVGAFFVSPGVSIGFTPSVAVIGYSEASTWFDMEKVLAYIQFVGCEFLLLSLLLAPHAGTLRREFWFAVCLLCLIPFISFGPSNDWCLRVSTPSLVVLMFITIQVLYEKSGNKRALITGIPIFLVLLIGALTPYFELARAVLWRPTHPNYGESLVEQQRGHLAPHYIGRLESSTLQILFKQPGRVPPKAERQNSIAVELPR